MYYGSDAIVSLAQQQTHANTTVTWCSGEMSGGGKGYLLDEDRGPNGGMSVVGGGPVGLGVELKVSGDATGSIAANAEA
ncbi:hypothetical protein [Limisphaera sp. VF-2]|uniref:hypothetical protein n=1 Tax=Limisphaera sp. VF-2 TaxID=3400418 RepID=UPI0017766184